jgi:hypothetical protein
MSLKFALVDKKELAAGESEEAEEHGMTSAEAHKTALQHLTKKNPHYYSIAKSVGLEEEELENMIKEWYNELFRKDNTGSRWNTKSIRKSKPSTTVGSSLPFGRAEE